MHFHRANKKQTIIISCIRKHQQKWWVRRDDDETVWIKRVNKMII